MKYLFSLIIAISFSSCICGGSEPSNTEYPSHIMPGDVVPKFTLTSTDGSTFNSDSIKKPTLLYFFWSECPDCSKTTKEVMKLWKNSLYSDKGVDVISIGRGGGESATLNKAVIYWSNMSEAINPVEPPKLFFDNNAEVYSQFAEQGVPRFYLTDSDGVVVWQVQSPLTTKEEILNQINTVKNIF